MTRVINNISCSYRFKCDINIIWHPVEASKRCIKQWRETKYVQNANSDIYHRNAFWIWLDVYIINRSGIYSGRHRADTNMSMDGKTYEVKTAEMDVYEYCPKYKEAVCTQFCPRTDKQNDRQYGNGMHSFQLWRNGDIITLPISGIYLMQYCCYQIGNCCYGEIRKYMSCISEISDKKL